jgi:uncharacterized protein (UPF0248 family)
MKFKIRFYNPFCDYFDEKINIHHRIFCPAKGVAVVRNVEKVGKNFVFHEKVVPLHR